MANLPQIYTASVTVSHAPPPTESTPVRGGSRPVSMAARLAEQQCHAEYLHVTLVVSPHGAVLQAAPSLAPTVSQTGSACCDAPVREDHALFGEFGQCGSGDPTAIPGVAARRRS